MWKSAVSIKSRLKLFGPNSFMSPIEQYTLPYKTTMWDCYWCVAMIFSDYWITVGEDDEKAFTMAYEYLSDPDRE